MRANTPEKFWSQVNKTDSCWLWTGKLNSGGYGIYMYLRITNLAHRVSYLWSHGSLIKGLQICHTCDVRKCVNPDHLFQGTRTENMQDASKKGRLKKYKRGNYCKRGHEYNDENSYLRGNTRICRQCIKFNRINRKEKKCQTNILTK